ncbi:hypothetical protein Dda_2067 [Drechslerella dactyloides]|uniref:RelA/SpoT domain-containing protein n=1 Tax=Drechslerella dactyloides TaxID=74499 RepID=A0AAD6J2U3_DREDA|nr:hypothetical protein Dda_2067 [Drechslerella dactyloides]
MANKPSHLSVASGDVAADQLNDAIADQSDAAIAEFIVYWREKKHLYSKAMEVSESVCRKLLADADENKSEQRRTQASANKSGHPPASNQERSRKRKRIDEDTSADKRNRIAEAEDEIEDPVPATVPASPELTQVRTGTTPALDYLEETPPPASARERKRRPGRIHAAISSRVKQNDRLMEKLQKRARSATEKPKYKTRDDILSDIVDLVGVRIALYFPGDSEEVGERINEHFDIVDSKGFPEKGNNDTSASDNKDPPRFGGYRAKHYRVRVKDDEMSEELKTIDPVVEIQVASVVMHAWAEVNHDLVYKALTTGEASEDEQKLLDVANGLALAGEGVLEQLQKATETRVTTLRKVFERHYELVAYLSKLGLTRAEMGEEWELEINLCLLRHLKIASAWELGLRTKTLGQLEPGSKSGGFFVLQHVLGELTSWSMDKEVDQERRKETLSKTSDVMDKIRYLQARLCLVGVQTHSDRGYWRGQVHANSLKSPEGVKNEWERLKRDGSAVFRVAVQLSRVVGIDGIFRDIVNELEPRYQNIQMDPGPSKSQVVQAQRMAGCKAPTRPLFRDDDEW